MADLKTFAEVSGAETLVLNTGFGEAEVEIAQLLALDGEQLCVQLTQTDGEPEVEFFAADKEN